MNRVLKIGAYRRLLAAYTLNELAFMVGVGGAGAARVPPHGQRVRGCCVLLGRAVRARVDLADGGRAPRAPPDAAGSGPPCTAFEALVFFALAWVAVHFALVPVLALALVDGVAALTSRSLARAATVSVTSAAGLLREGNAVSNAAFSVCFMLGPAIGGAVVAAGGTSAALIADGCLFALIGLTLATATGLPEPARTRASAKGRVRAALAYAREHVVIRRLADPAGVRRAVLHDLGPGRGRVRRAFAARGLGWLRRTAVGVGSGCGRRRGGLRPLARAGPCGTLIVIGAASLGIGFLVMAVAPTLAVAVVGAAIAGIGNGRRGRGRAHRAPGGDGGAVDGADDEPQRIDVPIGARRRDPARRRDHRAGKPSYGARGRGRRARCWSPWWRGSRWRRGPWQSSSSSGQQEPGTLGAGPERRSARSRTGVRIAGRRRRPSGDISRVRPRATAAVCARASPAPPIVRRACIDIGSNTTRLLVADSDGERLLEVHQERSFTHVRRGLTGSGEIGEEKIAEVASGGRRPAPGSARTRRGRRARGRHRGGSTGGKQRRAPVGGPPRVRARGPGPVRRGGGPARVRGRGANARLRSRRPARRRRCRRWIMRAGGGDVARSGQLVCVVRGGLGRGRGRVPALGPAVG